MMPEHGRGEHAGSCDDNNPLQMKLFEAGAMLRLQPPLLIEVSR
jgi:hypothetical protein